MRAALSSWEEKLTHRESGTPTQSPSDLASALSSVGDLS